MRFHEFKILKEAKQPFVISNPGGKRITPAIVSIQKALIALGYDIGPMGVDGIRGPYTTAAIKKFQADHNLKVDGDPQEETVGELNSVIQKQPELVDKISEIPVSDKAHPVALDTSSIQDPDFNAKLKKVADKLGISETDLRNIIKFETAGTFSASSHDPKNVSVGLIGFTEKTARSLGTSKNELAQMTPIEQLDYVYKFYKNVGVKPGMDLGTIYMLTFLPAFASASDDTLIGKKGGGDLKTPSGKNTHISMDTIWQQNPVFGKSKGRTSFTVGDVKNVINSR